jgi:hypothetical protein
MGSFDKPGWENAAPRRILGMKIWQAALLIGLAAMDCLVLVVGLILIVGSVPSSPSGGEANLVRTATPLPQPAEPTLPPTPSETPLTMIFQFPTYTPYGTPADTATLTPTATGLFDRWVKFSVPEVEIWMPETFAAGDPHTEAQAIIASLQEKGANFNWPVIEEQLTTAPENYVLWGIDSYQGNPAVVSFVFIAYDFANPSQPLADYATQFIGAVSADFILIEQQTVRHPVYEVARVIFETKETSQTPMRVALYAVRNENIIWDVMCFTAVDEMDGRLPAFNQMVDTFRVLASPR